MEYLKQNKRNINCHEISQGGWIHKFQFEHCYIQEVLTEVQVQKWRYDTPIFISSQTGTGKSTFILKTLCPIIRARGQPALILCSRIALKKQYKNNAISLFLPDREGDWTDKGMDKEHTFGCVDIYSYQEYQKLLESGKAKEYGAVIFDECHFFVNDASFNRYTQTILEKVMATQKKAVRVYMTATPDCVFDEILRMERKIKYEINTILCWQNRINCYIPALHEYGEDRPHAKIYHFQRDFSYLCTLFFKDLNRLIQMIQEDNSEKRWLIFVAKKEVGKIIENQLGTKMAEYLDAELKDNEKKMEFQKIIHEKTYSKKVLIVTKFLDIGVDLHDESIKNIVIFPTTKTDFLQMIGRKRIRKGERINLYICIRDFTEYGKHLNGLEYRYRESIQAISTKDEPGHRYELEMPLFYYQDHKSIKIGYNALSIVNIKQHITEVQELIQKCNQRPAEQSIDETMARFYLDWLGQEELYDKHSWIDGKNQDDVVKKIEEILNPVMERCISGDEFKDIKCKFLKLYEEYTGEKRRKDRSENGLGCSLIKRFFKDTQAPFRLVSLAGGIYRFERGQ